MVAVSRGQWIFVGFVVVATLSRAARALRKDANEKGGFLAEPPFLRIDAV